MEAAARVPAVARCRDWRCKLASISFYMWMVLMVTARSRTFMRSLAPEPTVGMLLFDEPSASLDPTAEHGKSSQVLLVTAMAVLTRTVGTDLFERLRHLRGDKTMIFSSHRFGNLTRHADLIL